MSLGTLDHDGTADNSTVALVTSYPTRFKSVIYPKNTLHFFHITHVHVIEYYTKYSPCTFIRTVESSMKIGPTLGVSLSGSTYFGKFL